MYEAQLIRLVKNKTRVSVRDVLFEIGEAFDCSGQGLYQVYYARMRKDALDNGLVDKDGRVAYCSLPEFIKQMIKHRMLAVTDGGMVYRKKIKPGRKGGE